MSKSHKDKDKVKDDEKLPPHWEKIQSAIWLIGLAILFWQDWIFPGVLVLVAISGLTQAALSAYVKQKEESEVLATTRELHLPKNCPNCGGPLSASTVQWQGKQTALCPFCGSPVKLITTPAP